MKSFLVSIAVVCLFLSCKKSNDTTAASSSSFTLNGTNYTSLKRTYINGTATSNSSLIDSAQNSGKTKTAGITLYFSSKTRPTAGTYGIAGSSTPSTTNFVTVYAIEQTNSSSHFFFYAINTPPTQTATVTDNGKLSVQLPQVTLTGQEYDVDFTHPVGSTFTTTLSASTFTEQ